MLSGQVNNFNYDETQWSNLSKYKFMYPLNASKQLVNFWACDYKYGEKIYLYNY